MRLAFNLARFSDSNFHIIVRMVSDRTYVRFFASYKMFRAEGEEEKGTRPQQGRVRTINEAKTDQARLQGLTL
jgi:hypothetical protein